MFELYDYQIFAIFLLGACIGVYLMLLINDRSEHPDWSWKKFIRYEWQAINGNKGDRTVKSDPHTID